MLLGSFCYKVLSGFAEGMHLGHQYYSNTLGAMKTWRKPTLGPKICECYRTIFSATVHLEQSIALRLVSGHAESIFDVLPQPDTVGPNPHRLILRYRVDSHVLMMPEPLNLHDWHSYISGTGLQVPGSPMQNLCAGPDA